MRNYKPSTGDIVQIVRNDGVTYECFIIDSLKEGRLLCGRVLDPSKVATTSWERYHLKEDCVCQPVEECKSISLVSKGTRIVVEDQKDAKVFSNTIPGTNRELTFCLVEDHGGWSESSDKDIALVESYSSAREEVGLHD